MKKISFVLLLLASAAGVGMNLLGYGRDLFAEAAVYESEAQASAGQAAAHNRNFINVDGADLRSRLDAAIKLGRSRSPQTRFWTAYTFDVRPGLGIDVVIMSSGGSITIVNGVVSGSSGKYETRNVGVFLLYERDGGAIVRAELYNLERAREYSGYPVYWLGRGGNEESLGLLTKLINSSTDRKVAEKLTDGVGAHDDPRAEGLLKELIRSSPVVEVRETAVSWVGRFPGNTPFLSDIARNEREPREVRKEAIDAIGQSDEAGAVAALKSLFSSLSDRELRKEIVEAAAQNREEDLAVDFLIKVAEDEPDREARARAVSLLGEMNEDRAADFLFELYSAGQDEHVKEDVLEALGESSTKRSLQKLIDIARSDPSPKMRKKAVQLLGERDDPEAIKFLEGIIK